MKTNIKRLTTAIALIFVLLLSLTACGKSQPAANNTQSGETATSSLPQSLVAQKMANFSANYASICDYGVIYQNENKQYGVVSFDGTSNTGAIYTDCRETGNFFRVTKKNLSNSASGMNIYGLLDSTGKEIIPEQYAYFYPINENYVIAYTAVAVTSNENDSLVYYNTGSNYVGYGSGNGTLYSGKWVVYSVKTKAPVSGVQGTSRKDYVNASGSYLEYRIGESDSITCDEIGEKLPDGAEVFDDGSLVIETTDGGSVYNPDGDKLFDYNPNDYTIYSSENGYYIAKKYQNSEYSYMVLDANGSILSKQFKDSITIIGDLIWCEDSAYDIKGEKIASGTYDSLKQDEMTRTCYALRDDDDYLLIDSKGNYIVEGEFSDPFAPLKGDKYYCVKDNSFSIKKESSALSGFLVSTTDGDGRYDAIDLLTGKTLIEGYSSLSANEAKDGGCYILAKRTEGGFDIWCVQNCIDAVKNGLDGSKNLSGQALRDIYQKREDLFNELAKEFENEGISATINRTSGEIALDSSVLFGGDSAVITDSGKKLLNSFTKVYASVLSNSKYDGFITKTMVEGHTAPVNGDTYEIGYPLSKERADNVKSYCLSKESGTDMSQFASKLEAIGYSNSKPVYNADGTVNMEASRRVSFRFVIANIG